MAHWAGKETREELEARLVKEVIDEVIQEESSEKLNERINSGYYETHPDVFMKDLLAAHGVSNDPKAPRAFSLAYEQGHSCGYSEVALVFADLVELIK